MYGQREMGSDNQLLGIDVGTTSVKACVLKRESDGTLALDVFDTIELPSSAIVDDVVVEQDVVVEAVRELVERNGVVITRCAMSLSGDRVFVARVPGDGLTAQDSHAIRTRAALALAGEFEEYIVDIDEGRAAGADDVIVAGAHPDKVNEMVAIGEGAGLQLTVLDIDACCLHNSLEAAYELRAGEVIALADVGGNKSRLIVVSGDQLRGTAVAPAGGEYVTRAIRTELGLSQVEAESYKVGGTYGSSGDGVVPRDVQDVMDLACRQVASRIAGALEEILQTYEVDNVDRIYLAGRSSDLSALRSALSEVADCEVERFDPFARIHIDAREFTGDYLDSVSASAAVAVGLALRSGDAH